MMTPPAERNEKETGRIEAFSDGMFAIAITLLVLNLKVPLANELAGATGLLRRLLEQWPSFAAYLTSFCTILIMWVNHHNLFNYIRRTDNIFMYSNGFLLLCITFLPFPTSLLAEYFRHPEGTVAAALYSGTFVLTAFAFNLVWRYASRNHRLIDHSITQAQIESINGQYLVGPTVYGIAFAVSFFDVPASFLITVVLAIFYAITGSVSKRK